MKRFLRPASLTFVFIAALLLLMGWWSKATRVEPDPAVTANRASYAQTTPAPMAGTPSDSSGTRPATKPPLTVQACPHDHAATNARADSGVTLPPDFLDRIVEGTRVAFQLPDGSTAAG